MAYKYDLGLEAMTMTEGSVAGGVHALSIGNYMPLRWPDTNSSINTGRFTKIFLAANNYTKNDSYSFLGKTFTVTNPKIVIKSGDYIKANFDFGDLTVRLINLSRTEYNPTNIVVDEYFGYDNLCECTTETQILDLPVVLTNDSDITFESIVTCSMREGNITCKMYIDKLDPTTRNVVESHVVSSVYDCNAELNMCPSPEFLTKSYDTKQKMVSIPLSHSLYNQDKGDLFTARVTITYNATTYEYEFPYEDGLVPRIRDYEGAIAPLTDTNLSIFAKGIDYDLGLFSFKIAEQYPDVVVDPNLLYDYDVYYRKIKNGTEIELFKIDIDDAHVETKKFWDIYLPEKINNLPVTKLHSGLLQHVSPKNVHISKNISDVGSNLTTHHSQKGPSYSNNDDVKPWDEDTTNILWENTGASSCHIGSGTYNRIFSGDANLPSVWNDETIEPYTFKGHIKVLPDSILNTPNVSAAGAYNSYRGSGDPKYNSVRDSLTIWRVNSAPNYGNNSTYGVKYNFPHLINDEFSRYGLSYSDFFRPDVNYRAHTDALHQLLTVAMHDPNNGLTRGDRSFKSIDEYCENIVNAGHTKFNGIDALHLLDRGFRMRNTIAIPDTVKYIKRFAFNQMHLASEDKFPEIGYNSRLFSFSIRGNKFYYDDEHEYYFAANGPALINGLGKNIRIVDKYAFNSVAIDQDLTIPKTARYINLISRQFISSDSYDGKNVSYLGTKITAGYNGSNKRGNLLQYSRVQLNGSVNTPARDVDRNEMGGYAYAHGSPFVNDRTTDGFYIDESGLSGPADIPQLAYNWRHMLTIEEPELNDLDDPSNPLRSEVVLMSWSQVDDAFMYNTYASDPDATANSVPFFESEDGIEFYQNYSYMGKDEKGKDAGGCGTYRTIRDVKHCRLENLFATSRKRIGGLHNCFTAMCETLTIPKNVTLAINRLEADDLIFEDASSELRLLNKNGTTCAYLEKDISLIPNLFSRKEMLWAERSYLHLAKYRGARGHDSPPYGYQPPENPFYRIENWDMYCLGQSWILNTRSNYDSLVAPGKSIPMMNIYEGTVNQSNRDLYDFMYIPDIAGTEPCCLVNDGEVGLHYSLAGNIICDVLVYPHDIDLSAYPEKDPTEYYDEGVFDPSSFDAGEDLLTLSKTSTSTWRYVGYGITTYNYLLMDPIAFCPAKLYFANDQNDTSGFTETIPDRIHGVTYLPKIKGVFPPCRNIWSGQRMVTINATVIGWHSITDDRPDLPALRCYDGFKSTTATMPEGYGKYLFMQPSSCTTYNYCRDFSAKYSDYVALGEEGLADLVYRSTYQRNQGNTDYACNEAELYSRSMSYLYFTQGTEEIRTDAVGIFPNLYRKTDDDYATIFFPPSLKQIDADAIKASNYVWYVPTGCTVAANYTTNSILKILRTREYRTHNDTYAHQVEIKYYDASNDMTSHYSFEDYADYSYIANFAASPADAPNQRKSIGTYLMPSMHNSVPVKYMAPLFSLNEDVRKVVGEVYVSENLEEIPDNCFKGCVRLFRTQIPANVTEIGDSAYEHCMHMYDLDCTASNITTIGEKAFAWCGSHNLDEDDLPEIVMGYDITDTVCREAITIDFKEYNIYRSRWSHMMKDKCAPNRALHKLDISHCTSIGAFAFFNSNMLSGVVTIPSTMTIIKEGTFAYCDSITKIVIPSSVTTIEANAFSHMRSLEEITIPSTVTTANLSFDGCVRLKKVKVEGSPRAGVSVADHGFRYCISMIECDLTGVGGSIGSKCFSQFGINVRSMDLYCSSLGDEAFVGCGVESITFHRNCTTRAIVAQCDNVHYNANGTMAGRDLNMSVKDVFADPGVTITITGNKNATSWFRTFPFDQCVLNQYTNNRNTINCCAISDLDTANIFASPKKNMLAGYGINPFPDITGNYIASAFAGTTYYRKIFIPLIIPDANWTDNHKNFCEAGEWKYKVQYEDTTSTSSDYELLYVKQSVYEAMSVEEKHDIFARRRAEFTAVFDAAGNLTNVTMNDITGMAARVMGDSGEITTTIPTLCEYEFYGSGVSDVTLGNSITYIPSHCFAMSALSEDSIQAMLDNPNITSYHSNCFAYTNSQESARASFLSDNACIIFNRKNANGEIVDKDGNIRKDIKALYDEYVAKNTPVGDDLFLLKERTGSGTADDPYVYSYPSSYTEQQKADDKAAATASLNEYFAEYRKQLMSKAVVTKYSASTYTHTAETVAVLDEIDFEIDDIWENGINSQYAANYIVIPLTGSYMNKLPRKLDLSSKPYSTSTYYGMGQFEKMTFLTEANITGFTALGNHLFRNCKRLHIEIPDTVRTITGNALQNTDIYGDYEFTECTFASDAFTASMYSLKDIGTITCWDCAGPLNIANVERSGNTTRKAILDTLKYGDFIWGTKKNETVKCGFNSDFNSFNFAPGTTSATIIESNTYTRTKDIIFPTDNDLLYISSSTKCTDNLAKKWDFKNLEFRPKLDTNGVVVPEELFTMSAGYQTTEARRTSINDNNLSTNYYEAPRVEEIYVNSPWFPPYFISNVETLKVLVLGTATKKIGEGFCCWNHWMPAWRGDDRNRRPPGTFYGDFEFTFPASTDLALSIHNCFKYDKAKTVDMTHVAHIAMSDTDLYNNIYTDDDDSILATDIGDKCQACAYVYNLKLPKFSSVRFPQATFAIWSTSDAIAKQVNMRTLDINGINKLPNYAFTNQSLLTTVTASIASTITLGTDGDSSTVAKNHKCFKGCSSMTTFPLEKLRGRLGYADFMGCTNLTNTETSVFSGITSCNAYSDYDPAVSDTSDGLEDPTTPNKSATFYGCSSLKRLWFDDTCTFTAIGTYFAYDCGSVREVRLPPTCTHVGYRAFYGCTALAKIYAPTGCTFDTDAYPSTTTVDYY